MARLTSSNTASSVEWFTVIPVLITDVRRSFVAVVGRIDDLAIKIVTRTVARDDIRRLVDVTIGAGDDYLILIAILSTVDSIGSGDRLTPVIVRTLSKISDITNTTYQNTHLINVVVGGWSQAPPFGDGSLDGERSKAILKAL